MQGLSGRHAPVMLAVRQCTVALGVPLTVTIVAGIRGGRAWLCHWRGAALGFPLAGLRPDSGAIDKACR